MSERPPDTLRPAGVFASPAPVDRDVEHAPPSRRPQRVRHSTVKGMPAVPVPPTTVATALEGMMAVDGAFACAVFDLALDRVIDSRCTRDAFDVVAVTQTYFTTMLHEQAIIEAAGEATQVQSLTVSLTDQHHLAFWARPWSGRGYFLVIDRRGGQLAAARRAMTCLSCPEACKS